MWNMLKVRLRIGNQSNDRRQRQSLRKCKFARGRTLDCGRKVERLQDLPDIKKEPLPNT
jgi:hypothetical protein